MAQGAGGRARFRDAASLVLNAIEEDRDTYLCTESHISSLGNCPPGYSDNNTKDSTTHPRSHSLVSGQIGMSRQCPECGQESVQGNACPGQ